MNMQPADLLAMNTVQLAKLSFDQYPLVIPEDLITHFLTEAGALWLHSGNPADPHAELTAGDCSNGFVDTMQGLKHANFCMAVARSVAVKVMEAYDGPIDWVIGSDHAGATFSFALAVWLGAKHEFTIKDGKEQAWNRQTIKEGEVVLQAEELMTTLSTLKAVRQGIRQGNLNPVTFAPVAVALVHRSDIYEHEGAPIVYGVHYDIQKWPPDECPLHKAGSRSLRPKANWAELTGRA